MGTKSFLKCSPKGKQPCVSGMSASIYQTLPARPTCKSSTPAYWNTFWSYCQNSGLHIEQGFLLQEEIMPTAWKAVKAEWKNCGLFQRFSTNSWVTTTTCCQNSRICASGCKAFCASAKSIFGTVKLLIFHLSSAYAKCIFKWRIHSYSGQFANVLVAHEGVNWWHLYWSYTKNTFLYINEFYICDKIRKKSVS